MPYPRRNVVVRYCTETETSNAKFKFCVVVFCSFFLVLSMKHKLTENV